MAKMFGFFFYNPCHWADIAYLYGCYGDCYQVCKIASQIFYSLHKTKVSISNFKVKLTLLIAYTFNPQKRCIRLHCWSCITIFIILYKNLLFSIFGKEHMFTHIIRRKLIKTIPVKLKTSSNLRRACNNWINLFVFCKRINVFNNFYSCKRTNNENHICWKLNMHMNRL